MKYLTGADVGKGVAVTIKQLDADGLHFVELEKPLKITNLVTIESIEKICGTGDGPKLIGKSIVLYNDPQNFAGKIVRRNQNQSSSLTNNMPTIHDLKSSNFLTRQDCGVGILCTIKGYERLNVAKEGAPEELKWALHFAEVEKPMILNSTNGQIIAKITNSEDLDRWAGHKIVLYDDPNVSFGGKLVGGIRVRAPRLPKPAQAPAPEPIRPSLLAPPLAEPDDGQEVPF